MKKIIILLMLVIVAMISMANVDRTAVIKEGMTMLSRPMAFSAADSIITSDTLNITITNLQKYLQNQVFTTTLTDVDGGSPSVVISAYGKVNSEDSWTEIGTHVTWTTSATVTISSTVAYNYNYLKMEYAASGATQHTKVATFTVKTSNCYGSGALATTGTFDNVVTNTAAGGDKAINVAITGNSTAITGNLIGAGIVATNGTSSGVTSGVIYGIEAKARAATSANAGAAISRLDGVYASVDVKNKTATTIRAFEASLDGGAGGASTEAVAFEAFNNSSATQTSSYAFSANGGTASGHKAYTADLRLQNGALINNSTTSLLTITEATTQIAGALNVAGAINSAIAGGTNVTSAGLLGGGGTATNATQTLGSAGGKAFSYYLSSTSSTATDNLIGYYMCVNYGATGGASAAPSGDVIRGRAYLMGDASGGTALTGGAFSVELEATTASNTGLTAGMRGNLVLPDGVLTNAGTYYGSMAEVYLGGAATDTRAYTEIAPLGIVVSGTPATSAAQLSNMVAMAFSVPANMVTTDGTMVVTGATAAVGAGLKISINGTPYWIMLATADE
jgi:hypothetical protein